MVSCLYCGYGDCQALDFFFPPLKNEDLSVPISVNFLLGTVIVGVWSSWNALAGPERSRLRPDWVALSGVGHFPPRPDM